jgi:hypothetical protein
MSSERFQNRTTKKALRRQSHLQRAVRLNDAVKKQRLSPSHFAKQLQDLSDDGYFITELKLRRELKPTSDELAAMKIDMMQKSKCILQEHDGGTYANVIYIVISRLTIMFFRVAVGDRKRLMLPVDPDTTPIAHVYQRAVVLLNCLFPHLKCVDATLLLSLEHCSPQVPHCDGSIGSTLYKIQFEQGVVPLSAFIAFQASTTLRVWRASHKRIWEFYDFSVPSEHSAVTRPGEDGCSTLAHLQRHVELSVPAFSLVVFRQDLVHAGSGYSEDNIRMHFYLDPVNGPSGRDIDEDGESRIHPQDHAHFV